MEIFAGTRVSPRTVLAAIVLVAAVLVALLAAVLSQQAGGASGSMPQLTIAHPAGGDEDPGGDCCRRGEI